MNYRMLLARAAFCGLATFGYAYGGVINPGFETGDFTGWTQFGDPSYTAVAGPSIGCMVVGDCTPHSGSFAAFFGNSLPGGITQSIATLPGFTYSLDFWLSVGVDKTVGNAPLNGYKISWDSTVLADVGNPLRAGGWQPVSLTATATGLTSLLTFEFNDNTDAFGLDDVSVAIGAPVTDSAVPEPVSLILAGTSLIALAGLSRMMRRNRR